MTILYEGPSLLDGKPIVAIMVGDGKRKSINEKTGAMAQVYIIRSDIPPVQAAKSGEDVSICGACPHRHSTGGSCYVNVGQGPRAIYEAYKRGHYERNDARTAGFEQDIRIGAYGDPGAVPMKVWWDLIMFANSWTGYTHQHQLSGDLMGINMASADSREEAIALQAKGWKTFRVKTPEEPLIRKEILCLNETNGVKCKDCGICDGRTANVAINIHGTVGKIHNFKKWALNDKISNKNAQLGATTSQT